MLLHWPNGGRESYLCRIYNLALVSPSLPAIHSLVLCRTSMKCWAHPGSVCRGTWVRVQSRDPRIRILCLPSQLAFRHARGQGSESSNRKAPERLDTVKYGRKRHLHALFGDNGASDFAGSRSKVKSDFWGTNCT